MTLSHYYNAQQLSMGFGWHSHISPAAGGSPSLRSVDLSCMGLKQRCALVVEGLLKIPLSCSGVRKSLRQIAMTNNKEKKKYPFFQKFLSCSHAVKPVWKKVAPKLYINLLLKPLCRVDTAFKSAGNVLDACVLEAGCLFTVC